MDFIKKLESLGMLRGGIVCDVGAGPLLNESKRLAQFGYQVDAIDIAEPKEVVPGVNFYNSQIEDFSFDKKFSLILAQNVLFFTQNPFTELKKLLEATEPAGVVYFTMLGKKDEWNGKGKVVCVEKEEIDSLLVQNNFEIVFKSEEEGLGKTMLGATKFWHMYRYIVRKI